LDEVAHTCFDTPSKVIAGIECTIVQRVREVQDYFGQIAHHAQQHIQLAQSPPLSSVECGASRL
jgi:exodeoxyribonuclease VII large subunit